MPLNLPDGVIRMADRGPDWAAWVEQLPHLAAEFVEAWELVPDGLPTHGFTALVLPVVDRRGRAGVLKLGFPDDESEHEHLALTHWSGDGAVLLQRGSSSRRARWRAPSPATRTPTAPSSTPTCTTTTSSRAPASRGW